MLREISAIQLLLSFSSTLALPVAFTERDYNVVTGATAGGLIGLSLFAGAFGAQSVGGRLVGIGSGSLVGALMNDYDSPEMSINTDSSSNCSSKPQTVTVCSAAALNGTHSLDGTATNMAFPVNATSISNHTSV